MSTFKRILAEKTGRKDYGRKGGQGGTRSTSSTPYERRESRANMQDPSNTRNKKLGTDKPRVIKAPDGSVTYTNMPEPSGSVTTDQVIDTADRRAKKGSSRGSGGGFGPSKDDAARYAGKPDTAQQAAAADDIRGRKGTDPTARKAASNVLGGGRKTPPGEELIGGDRAKEGTGGRYRQRRPSDVRSSGVSQAKSSKQQAAYRRARQQLKASGTKFFGKPTGVDAQGKPTYVPPKETPKGETGRRAQRQASPRSYASVKAEIEGAKGFSGSKSGGLETRSVPKPVTDYRQKRAARAGTPDPFDTKTKFSQKDFDKSLRKILKKQAVTTRAVTTANPLSQAEFKSKLVRGKNRPPLFPKPDFPATVPSTKPKPPTAPDRTATKQAVKDIRAVQQRLNVKTAPTTGGQVTKSKPATPPARTANLAVRQGNPLYQGAFDAAMKGKGPSNVVDVDVKSVPKKPTLNPSQQKKVTQRILKTAKPQLGRRLATKTVPDLAKKVSTQAATKTAVKRTLAGTVGRGLAGAAGAAFDVVQGREDAKKAGASDRRAWLRGAARAAGGLVGGTLGAIGGGGIGSAALGIGGYMAGSQIGDKLFTSLAGATKKQKDWLRQKNLATQAGTRAKDVQYRKGNQAVVFDKRVGKERIGTWDPKSQTYKAGVTNPVKAYTAKNPFERLGRQFSRSNEGSGLFGMGLVKGYGLADMAKRYYANKDEAERRKRVSDFKRTATR